jgi:hypothetical protein
MIQIENKGRDGFRMCRFGDNNDNSDLGGHKYFGSNATQSWNWTITSNSGNQYWSYAITFLSPVPPPATGTHNILLLLGIG